MKLKDINVTEVLRYAKESISESQSLNSEMKILMNSLVIIVESILPNTVTANSKNSNTSPSQDPFRKKKPKEPSNKKPGGQLGHEGNNLKIEKNPDKIVELKLDKKTLPKGNIYTKIKAKIRQVTDIIIKRKVTEYQAEAVVDQNGKEYVASFPDEVKHQTQYGNSVKAQVVYLATFQMLPFKRNVDFFVSHGINISEGTIDNILKLAFEKLEPFEKFIKYKLLNEGLLHADETGVNLNGKNAWVHNYSTKKYTFLFGDLRRGKLGMDQAGILPEYKGILVHDHWKAYENYEKITHIFCNDHISRELQRVFEITSHSWSSQMKNFLQELNKTSPNPPKDFSKTYDNILDLADIECPQVSGRKQSKERNLIKRLRKYKSGTIAFADSEYIPFTNNQAERDLRMLKVKLKVSGCFKTMDGLQRFCRIRSFISTCNKHGIGIHDALLKLFDGKLNQILDLLA